MMVMGKDNSLLVEFEFVIDLDLAMFRFIRDNYFESEYVYHEFLSVPDEQEVIFNLLSRKHINPLEYIIPGRDTTTMYHSLICVRKVCSTQSGHNGTTTTTPSKC